MSNDFFPLFKIDGSKAEDSSEDSKAHVLKDPPQMVPKSKASKLNVPQALALGSLSKHGEQVDVRARKQSSKAAIPKKHDEEATDQGEDPENMKRARRDDSKKKKNKKKSKLSNSKST